MAGKCKVLLEVQSEPWSFDDESAYKAKQTLPSNHGVGRKLRSGSGERADHVLWNERRCPGSRPRRLSISSPASIAPLHGSLVRDGLGKSYGHAEHSPYDLQIDAPYLLHILSAHGALGKNVNGSTTHAYTAVTAR